MGSLFAEEFRKRGHEVLVTNEEKSNNVEISGKGNLVIVTVPINKTEEVLKEVIPHVREDALLTDFTSMKEKPLDIMKNASSSFIGGHPLFGPVESLEDKNFVLTPGRGDFSWYKDLLESLGLKVTVMDAKEHDREMAIIQCLTNFTNLSFAYALNRLNFNEKLSTPTYKLRMKAIERMFSQKAELFSEIQFRNELSKKMAENYLDAVHELSEIISKGDKEKFKKIFNETKKNREELK